ncbi:hypothetical protein VMCG_05308 [Cytospora schulzeri]|uniref:Uncharacterized protein n=1 Tax=Cytospora schulzeri TaxID=448051 RepID=A0A423WQT5_9PEZI|nr:hypothetical protein VMCG_05308 [Valsa malicola]
MSSLRVHGSQGPSSRQSISSKAKKVAPKIDPILKTFHRGDKMPPPEAPGAALFDMRKRLSRVVSHGGNVIDHLLKEFGLQPLTGIWVLKDDHPAGGAWIVTNPRKGYIKFVHDDYDPSGRLRATKPDPMPTVIRTSGIYAELLADANRFVAEVCEEYGLKKPVLPDPEREGGEEGKAAAKAKPKTREEKVTELRVKRGKARDEAKRRAEKEEAERRRQEKRPPVIPDLARTRFREWQRRKREKIRETPSLSYEERHTMIETTRELLKEVVATRIVKPGWWESLEVRLYERDV